MKVLIVCSGNFSKISPFVREQAEALERAGIEIEYFLIKGKGFLGYLKNLPDYYRKINKYDPEIVHAHYGLSGLLACLQRKVPVVVTFHGSDLNKFKPKFFSLMAAHLSKVNIYVSEKLIKIAGRKTGKKNHVIPCGIDPDKFQKIPKHKAREIMNLKSDVKYILFTAGFDNSVKNYPLCFESIKALDIPVELIELIGYNREEVNLLMNAADVLIMTSFSEGSPQVIKEALAVGLPVVSRDIGDVDKIISNTNSEISTVADDGSIAAEINRILKRERSRENNDLSAYDNTMIASRIIKIYQGLRN